MYVDCVGLHRTEYDACVVCARTASVKVCVYVNKHDNTKLS